MTRDELIARLKGYEWTDFECKKAQREVPKDAYTTVSAFANTQGGWLLFGVSENNGQLEVTGVDPATLRRNDDPPDYVSFREAAINLLIHQDYGDHFRKAVIKFFIDQTLFWNPGDAIYTESELLDPTEKEVRNPSIVKAFRRIGMSDQAGSGIRAIFRNWRELGHVPPQIHNDKSRKSFELVLLKKQLVTDKQKVFMQTIGVKLNADEASVFAFATEKGSVNLTDIRALTSITITQAKALAERLAHQQLLVAVSDDNYQLAPAMQRRYGHCEQEQTSTPEVTRQVPDKYPTSALQVGKILHQQGVALSRAELQQALGLADREHFSKEYLQPAMASGLVAMTIPDKPRSSKQRYRLTELGRTVLEKQK